MSERTSDEQEQGITDPVEEVGPAVIPPAVPNKLPLGIWIGVGSLFIIALLVIFVLPAVVSEYELPLERRVEVAQPAPQATVAAISPFEEAQRAIQRKDAQDVLAALLEIQEQLTAVEVEQWGQPRYDDALEQASIGDQYYREQDFILALRSYETSRDRMQDLLDAIPTELQQTLIEGQNALAVGNAQQARAAYSLALLFDPESVAAQQGMQRANNLEQVTGLVRQSEDLLQGGNLQQALAVLQQARQLDPYDPALPPRIDNVNARIREAEFARIMSSGYARLSDGDPEGAIVEFQRAANLGINQEEARAAITQTENEIASVQINRLRGQIADAESGERWQEAADYYREVLAIDTNLTFAIDGLDYASKRANLDQLLEDAIANPERFADEQVFRDTRGYLAVGEELPNPGPRLSSQLRRLRSLMEESLVPLDISFVSDNQTQVSLQRVGELGTFEQTTLSLKPGRYVAIGRRNGFREVREEFTVGFGQTPELVTVRCEERVIATRR